MIELFYLFLELVNNYKHYKHNYFVVYKAFVSYFSDLQKWQSRNVNGPSSYFVIRRHTGIIKIWMILPLDTMLQRLTIRNLLSNVCFSCFIFKLNKIASEIFYMISTSPFCPMNKGYFLWDVKSLNNTLDGRMQQLSAEESSHPSTEMANRKTTSNGKDGISVKITMWHHKSFFIFYNKANSCFQKKSTLQKIKVHFRPW